MMPKSDGPALTLGLRVSEFILRDKAMLQSSSHLTYPSREEPNPAALQRQRVIKQAQIVKEQMRKILLSSPILPNQTKKQMGAKPFEFQKLPPEIRDLRLRIYEQQREEAHTSLCSEAQGIVVQSCEEDLFSDQ
jgi:hypothetical protein